MSTSNQSNLSGMEEHCHTHVPKPRDCINPGSEVAASAKDSISPLPARDASHSSVLSTVTSDRGSSTSTTRGAQPSNSPFPPRSRIYGPKWPATRELGGRSQKVDADGHPLCFWDAQHLYPENEKEVDGPPPSFWPCSVTDPLSTAGVPDYGSRSSNAKLDNLLTDWHSQCDPLCEVCGTTEARSGGDQSTVSKASGIRKRIQRAQHELFKKVRPERDGAESQDQK